MAAVCRLVSASVVPHRATSEVEVVVAVAGRWRKAIRQQAPLNCFWGNDLGLSVPMVELLGRLNTSLSLRPRKHPLNQSV